MMLVNPTLILPATQMILGATSQPQQLTQTFAYGLQAVYTGTTISGSIHLEASINHKEDTQGNVLFEGDWDTINGSQQNITGSGTGVWNVGSGAPGYPWVRVVYVDTGSSPDATLTVTGYIRGV